jgi:Fe-S cluster biogenesis protein NfuA
LNIIVYFIIINRKYDGGEMVKEDVEKVLEKVREGLRRDGGDIELVEIKDKIVYVRLKGACGSCPMSTLTLKNWVEVYLKKEIPEISSVQAV